jgi:hypothetical protein
MMMRRSHCENRSSIFQHQFAKSGDDNKPKDVRQNVTEPKPTMAHGVQPKTLCSVALPRAFECGAEAMMMRSTMKHVNHGLVPTQDECVWA